MTVAATISMPAAAARTWDAVVVGAGPAGAMAAHELARRRLAVLLVDRAAFPRWKVCGCCLNRHALAALRGAGLGGLTDRAGAVPLEGLHLAAAGRSARVPLAGGVSLSREAFDAALVSSAIDAGAAFLPRTQAAFAPHPKGVGEEDRGGRTVQLRHEQEVACVRARVVLAAGGLGGQRSAGAVVTSMGARIGAGAVVADAPPFYAPGVIFMVCGRSGYLGLVRLEDGRLDLAAAFDPAAVRDGGPGAAAGGLLAEVGWPAVPGLAGQTWRGTPALTRQARRVAGERLFVLGDAAGYVEPFTGEGMAWALSAARAVAPLAAEAARCWRPGLAARWATTYRRRVGRRQLVCRAVAAVLRHPGLTRSVIRLLACAPALARPVTRYLGAAAGERPA